MSVTYQCPKCQKEKTEDEFPLPRNPSGRIRPRHCWDCRRAYYWNYRQQHREQHLRASRRYHLRTKYGITLDRFEELMEKQGRVCAICGRSPNGRSLDVDHNHQTGKIRGLLCIPCNASIGALGDNPHTLQRAIEYLQQAVEV